MKILVESKGWDWANVKDNAWSIPASEIYHPLYRWKSQNKKAVLDLGCGIGRHSMLLARNGFKVHSFDISEEGLKVLNQSAKEENLDINTNYGDMLSLPYKDAAFDCVVAFNVIYHSDRIGLLKVISEIKRVLVSDGEFFLTLISKNNASYLETDNVYIDSNTVIKNHGIEKDIPHYFVDEREIPELLSGFEIITIKLISDLTHGKEHWHYYILARKLAF